MPIANAREVRAASATAAVWDAKKFRPGLDILRAIAVAAVFIFHTRHHYLPGGSLGVDLFFAISGFLITGLLIREIDASGKVNFKKFLARRAVRLLPALVVVILTLAVLGKVTLFQACAALLYFANWVKRVQGDYALGNVLHTWSLSAEEQFYLVWPLLIMMCFTVARLRKTRPRVAVFFCAMVGVVISLAMSLHMETLFAGSMFALLMPELMRRGLARVIVCMSVIGGALLLVLMVRPEDGIVAKIAVMASTVIVVAGAALWTPSEFGLKLTRPVLWVGRISYGIYLWHFPLYMILPLGMSPTTRTAMVLGLTLLLATASWYLLEKPVAQRLRPVIAGWK